jgi:uncharacterized Zn finger protein
MGYRNYWSHYEPTRPIEVKGGIKAQSRSGGFGESWWAQRWIDVLESFHMGPRLGRGKAYARKGQVLSISVGEGLITAEVQGSRPKPYKVEMKVKTLAQAAKKKLLKEIGESILFAVKLHSGEMPKELEELFMSSGLPLFPQKYSEMKTDCSCPDWSDPCKHIAAVCYLLAEEFDRDPFLIVKLRGLSRDELVSATASTGNPACSSDIKPFSGEEAAVDQEPIPLSSDSLTFWGLPEAEDAFTFNAAAPSTDAHIVRRLGKFPFWRGSENLIDAMESVYRAATISALEALAGTSGGEGHQGGDLSGRRGKKAAAKRKESPGSGTPKKSLRAIPVLTGEKKPLSRAGMPSAQSERLKSHSDRGRTATAERTRLGKQAMPPETAQTVIGKKKPGRPKKNTATTKTALADIGMRKPGRPKKNAAATETTQTVIGKRKPGRPKKNTATTKTALADIGKRKPGRPKKNDAPTVTTQTVIGKRKPGRPKKNTATTKTALADIGKKKPGRPKKNTATTENTQADIGKRKPGRPKKNTATAETTQAVIGKKKPKRRQ